MFLVLFTALTIFLKNSEENERTVTKFLSIVRCTAFFVKNLEVIEKWNILKFIVKRSKSIAFRC